METYAEKIGKLLDKEKDIIDNVEISIKNINRIWNKIRDMFKKANNELPKKKDEELIENELIEHFRSFVGKKLNSNEKLKERWIRQYSPIQDINECWYNEVIQPISESEWDHMIKQLANDKAPGISQISNEMLKHMGASMKSATLKLANLCLQVGDIPEEWRHTLLYPIPKTMDWEYSLTKTRPIILLETLRKVLVKIVTKRLSKVIAGLPGRL
ncbi:unnamed protein product [Rhizophagus irregularis]|nr:unnamed protein product [Rhizophagus irregularis]